MAGPGPFIFNLVLIKFSLYSIVTVFLVFQNLKPHLAQKFVSIGEVCPFSHVLVAQYMHEVVSLRKAVLQFSF